jgi:hypothetical protein
MMTIVFGASRRAEQTVEIGQSDNDRIPASSIETDGSYGANLALAIVAANEDTIRA